MGVLYRADGMGPPTLFPLEVKMPVSSICVLMLQSKRSSVPIILCHIDKSRSCTAKSTPPSPCPRLAAFLPDRRLPDRISITINDLLFRLKAADANSCEEAALLPLAGASITLSLLANLPWMKPIRVWHARTLPTVTIGCSILSKQLCELYLVMPSEAEPPAA